MHCSRNFILWILSLCGVKATYFRLGIEVYLVEESLEALFKKFYPLGAKIICV